MHELFSVMHDRFYPMRGVILLAREVFCLIDKVFQSIDEVISVMHKVFSVIDEVFLLMHEVFQVIDDLPNPTGRGFAGRAGFKPTA